VKAAQAPAGCEIHLEHSSIVPHACKALDPLLLHGIIDLSAKSQGAGNPQLAEIHGSEARYVLRSGQ